MSRPIDADALIVDFWAPSYTNREPCKEYVSMEQIRNALTIEPERGECHIHIDDVYRLVSGHSDYHGDDILAAFQCLVEGKIVNPIKPLSQTETVRKTGKWINGYCSECGCHAPFYSMSSTYRRSNYCPDCGSYNGTETEKNNEHIYENDR